MKNNQWGVTLVELVMSLLIMSGITYMVMHQQEVAGQAQGKSGFDLEITNLGTHIRDALSDVPSCSLTVNNIVPGTLAGGVVTGGDITKIFRGIANARVANKDLLVSGQEAGKGVVVKQIQLFVDGEQDQIRVTYEATDALKKVMTGGTTVSKDYFIVGTKDPATNTFTDCGAIGVNASDEDVCASIQSGSWNSTTNTCDLLDYLVKPTGLVPVFDDGAGEFKITNNTPAGTLSCSCSGSICANDPSCFCNVGNCPAGQVRENPVRRVTNGSNCDLEAICYNVNPVINETPLGMLVQP